jgi:Cu+-exporting ATPase
MPMAIMVGTGKGAEHGIFIRNVRVLELAQKIEVVLIDKTGTLTQGEPEVTDIIGLGLVEEEVLSLAATAEYGSEHPFGKAIVDEAKARGFELDRSYSFEAFPGYGVKATVNGAEVVVGNLELMSDLAVDLKEANKLMHSLSLQGKTPIFVSTHGEICGIIGLADRLKSNAGEAIEALYKLGLEVIMLTGDNHDVAEYISRQIHMNHPKSSLKMHIVSSASPKGKLSYVRELQRNGKVVAMVGDGINDAPALTQADVGIAIGSGVDVAIEASDVTLIGGDLFAVSKAISLSRVTMKTIKQNMFWACIYNIGLIPIAAGILYPLFSNGDVPHLLRFALGEFGFLNPMLAAVAMTLSSITVMGNSLLLRKHLKPNKLDLGKEMS